MSLLLLSESSSRSLKSMVGERLALEEGVRTMNGMAARGVSARVTSSPFQVNNDHLFSP